MSDFLFGQCWCSNFNLFVFEQSPSNNLSLFERYQTVKVRLWIFVQQSTEEAPVVHIHPLVCFRHYCMIIGRQLVINTSSILNLSKPHDMHCNFGCHSMCEFHCNKFHIDFCIKYCCSSSVVPGGAHSKFWIHTHYSIQNRSPLLRGFAPKFDFRRRVTEHYVVLNRTA